MTIETSDSFAQWRDKINNIIAGSGSGFTTASNGDSIAPDSRTTLDVRTEDITVSLDSGLFGDGDTVEFVAIGRGSGFSAVIDLDGIPFEGSTVEGQIEVDVYETFFKLLYVDAIEGVKVIDD